MKTEHAIRADLFQKLLRALVNANNRQLDQEQMVHVLGKKPFFVPLKQNQKTRCNIYQYAVLKHA